MFIIAFKKVKLYNQLYNINYCNTFREFNAHNVVNFKIFLERPAVYLQTFLTFLRTIYANVRIFKHKFLP